MGGRVREPVGFRWSPKQGVESIGPCTETTLFGNPRIGILRRLSRLRDGRGIMMRRGSSCKYAGTYINLLTSMQIWKLPDTFFKFSCYLKPYEAAEIMMPARVPRNLE